MTGLYPAGVTGREVAFAEPAEPEQAVSSEDCRSCGETSRVLVTIEVEADERDERTRIRSWQCPRPGCQAANEETVTEEREDPDVDWSAW